MSEQYMSMPRLTLINRCKTLVKNNRALLTQNKAMREVLDNLADACLDMSHDNNIGLPAEYFKARKAIQDTGGE